MENCALWGKQSLQHQLGIFRTNDLFQVTGIDLDFCGGKQAGWLTPDLSLFLA